MPVDQPVETIVVSTTIVTCDGGGPDLGHPNVFLAVGENGAVVCPYCGRLYRMKAGIEQAQRSF